MVEYLDEEYTEIFAPVNRPAPMGLLPGQGEDGYGKKITTEKMVKLSNGKMYRVYATCISNVASHWILKEGKKIHLR